MDTKDQIATGTRLQHPTNRLTSQGAHTAAPPRAATPPHTGSLTNRGGGARTPGFGR